MEERQFDLEEAIKFLIEKTYADFTANWYRFYVHINDNTIEVGGKKTQIDNEIILLTVIVKHEFSEVLIPIFYLPIEERGKKLGMFLIDMIFKISQRFQYTLCMVQMTDSFKDKMISKGAVQANLQDAVLITDSTKLY